MQIEFGTLIATRQGGFASGGATWEFRNFKGEIVRTEREPLPLPKMRSESWEAAQRDFIRTKVEGN